MAEISLTQADFKALSSDSRTRILKILEERNFTLSELSAKTGMAAPTVKQHASILVDSGLIELRDEGRKWKYYALTRKGRDLLGAGKANHANVLIVLAGTVFGVVALLFLFGTMTQTQIGANYAPADERANVFDTAPAQANKKIVGNGDMQEQNLQTSIAGGAQATEPQCSPNMAELESVSEKDMEFIVRDCAENDTKEKCEAFDNYSTLSGFGYPDNKADCVWNFAAQG